MSKNEHIIFHMEHTFVSFADRLPVLSLRKVKDGFQEKIVERNRHRDEEKDEAFIEAYHEGDS